MADLPEEVLVNVLSRLPVKSLVRFRCVCKLWYALFKNPNFVSKHIINQSEDDTIVLISSLEKGNRLYVLSNVDDGGDSDLCFEDLDLHLDSEFPYEWWRFLSMNGQCNGLVALSGFDEEVFLCNPATREFRILPNSSFHPFPKCPGYCCPATLHAETDGIGFGYDPKTDDYKVVRIIGFWFDRELNGRLPSKAEVFSLYANSTWREINHAIIGTWGALEGQLFDGFYYWLGGHDIHSSKKALLSFDMAEEVFNTTLLPDICQLRDGFEENNIGLGVFNNKSIALFVSSIRKFEPCIEVWVMKEYGLKESWTKQLTIGPLLGLQNPLLFWNNDKELLHDNFRGQLSSYNLGTLENRNVYIEGGALVCFTTDTYRKTLVSVKAREDIAA